MILSLVIVAIIIIEISWYPRIDYVALTGKYLLWYGRRNRKYIVLN